MKAGPAAAGAARVAMAMDAWQDAVYDMYNPAVPEPEVSFNPDYKEPFYIDMEDWTVHLNLSCVSKLDDEAFYNFVRSISHHELGHYTSCPYDGVTNALMLQAASREVGIERAPVACNVVSDMIIEFGLARRFEALTRERFDTSLVQVASGFTPSRPPSATWKLIVLAESKVTGFRIPASVLGAVNFSDVEVDAGKLARMVTKDVAAVQKWPSLCRRAARLMKPYLANDFPVMVSYGNVDPRTGYRDSPGNEHGHVHVPSDVLEQSGDVTKVSDRDNGRLNERALKARAGKKGKGKGKEGREPGVLDPAGDAGAGKILEELAKNARGIGEFGGPATALGLVRTEHVLATWYRYRSAGLVRVDALVRKHVGQLPVAPDTWRLGDPVESLDLPLTLLNSPVVIPNVTTRKWEHRLQEGTFPDKACPDFLIVIDSSYSMSWRPAAAGEKARGEYDIALVAAFAAVHHARKKGVKVAAINFSGSHVDAPWTRDTAEIERILLRYEGDGTVLPTPAIIEMVRRRDGGSRVLVFIISDAGLHDWQGSIPPLMAVVEAGHGIVMFLIGGNQKHLEQKRFQDFIKKGGKIYCITTVEDLIGLVVQEIRGAYDS